MKKLIFVLILQVICIGVALGQSQDNAAKIVTPQMPGIANPLATTGAISTPAMRGEDLLAIRNLQFAQDKKLLEMQRIEMQYQKLQDSVRQDGDAIEAAIRNGARRVNIDLSKFIFNLDSLTFVPRPETAKPVQPEPTKPMEVKPNAKKSP